MSLSCAGLRERSHCTAWGFMGREWGDVRWDAVVRLLAFGWTTFSALQ